MTEQKSHHYIYGTLNDYLTGAELTDTDDERIRQTLSRMMVEEKHFHREELQPRLYIDTFFARCFVRSVIELTVSLAGRQLLVLRYGPGSLVSRERAAIAAARVIAIRFAGITGTASGASLNAAAITKSINIQTAGD